MPKNQLTYITNMAEQSRYQSYFLALPPYAAPAACRSLRNTGRSASIVLRLISLGFHFESFWLGRSLGDTFPVLSH